MTDTEFLLSLLMEGPQTRESVIRRCYESRRPGLVVNSRVSELRKRGHMITCRREWRPGRRDSYIYTLERVAIAA